MRALSARLVCWACILTALPPANQLFSGYSRPQPQSVVFFFRLSFALQSVKMLKNLVHNHISIFILKWHSTTRLHHFSLVHNSHTLTCHAPVFAVSPTVRDCAASPSGQRKHFWHAHLQPHFHLAAASSASAAGSEFASLIAAAAAAQAAAAAEATVRAPASETATAAVPATATAIASSAIPAAATVASAGGA